MNRLDLLIMKKLKEDNAVNAVNALTIDEVNQEKTVCSRVYLNKKLNHLCNQGFVAKGVMARQASTYYITPKGLEVIESV